MPIRNHVAFRIILYIIILNATCRFCVYITVMIKKFIKSSIVTTEAIYGKFVSKAKTPWEQKNGLAKKNSNQNN